MLVLMNYLQTHFPTSGSWKNEDVINTFLLEFGVNVSVEAHTDNKYLFLFKYDMLSAKWIHPLTHECRGIILRNSDSGWEIMSHPFHKFFNLSEGNCPIFNEEVFAKELPYFSFARKEDGTCIQCWFDSYLDKWRVSTLGTITTLNIHDSGVSFESLFLQTIRKDLFYYLDKQSTYIFELCTSLNRVVSRYAKDKVFIIGMRDNVSGNLYSYDALKVKFALFLSDPSYNIFLPYNTPLSSLGITSIQSANSWVESQSKPVDGCEYPEGFVVYNQYGPVAKIKNSMYLALHHSLSDPACTRKSVIASFFKGTMDDLYAALPIIFQQFADRLKDWLNQTKVRMNTEVAPGFHQQTFSTRKDYALYVQSLPQDIQMFRGFFFSNQEGVCDSTKNLGELFSVWIQQNFEKYEDYWKSLCP